MELEGSKRLFGFHKNNQSEWITFTPQHFVSTHGLPSVHQRSPIPSHPLPRSQSQALPTPDDVISQLKSELSQHAEEIAAKARNRQALEAQLARPRYTSPPPEDVRNGKNELEKERKEQIRQRTFEQLRAEIQRKEALQVQQEQQRVQKAHQREAILQELEDERLQQSQHRASQQEMYRKTLQTLQSFPTKFDTEQWKEASATVSDLGGLVAARYTKKHPKVIYTDPIAFEYPRSPQAQKKEALKQDAAVFFGADREGLAGTTHSLVSSRALSQAGKMTLAQYYREPVRDKHSGLNYRDTRHMLV